MAETINARIPPHLEQKLADYCAKRRVTRSQAVLRALDENPDRANDGPSPYSLSADLIPKKEAKPLQSGDVRKLARRAFGGKRSA